MNYKDKISQLSKLIGNTPLIKITCEYQGTTYDVFCKLEQYNLTGSIKDRMVVNLLNDAYEKNVLNERQEIVEATSGNTGISLAAIGGYLGHPVTIFLPDWMSKERIELIRSFGAKIKLVSAAEGGFIGSIEKAAQYAKENNCFLAAQFSNKANVEAHYLTTGPEIVSQMKENWIDAFVSGIGTGGTIMGIGNYLKNSNQNIQIYAMEPASSPVLKTGTKVGSHRIQGISDEFVPPIVDQHIYEEIIDVEDGDAIIMAQRLAKELGLGVGISSGANFLAALKIQLLTGKKNIVTVFADDNKKYLSTDYGKKEKVQSSYLSKDIQLINYQVLDSK